MVKKVQQSFEKLKIWCEENNFRGWDPYDGLNSKVFQSVPLINKSRIFRLAWIQLFKRNPINLRPLFLIEKGFNPKGLGLFLEAYCNLFKIDPKREYLEKINVLCERIISLQSKGFSGACWGYNFDWQAKAFFQPKYFPTVVATSFISTALLNAFEITQNNQVKEIALSSADFILNDLNRTIDETGNFCFSYSPSDNTQVFNASLLGSRLLAKINTYTKNENLIAEAKKSVQYCINNQKPDGSWAYGTASFQQWIDNFHTGYNLMCIAEYAKFSNDNSYSDNIKKGLNFYLNNFFTNEGLPKYYHNKLYPIDIHTTAQLILTLSKLNVFDENVQLMDKVLNWTIDNMQDKKGYFYYQIKERFNSKIPYIRWAQAWMFYAMSEYLFLKKNVF